MIREAIKTRMQEVGITQVMLARELGLSRPNLTAFLSGSRPLPLGDLERILERLRLTIKPEE